MKIYETVTGFYLLNQDEKLPLGAKVYEIDFPRVAPNNCREVFPQFDLKISSWADYPHANYWEIIYKNEFRFTSSVSNPFNYIVRLLNDLRNGNRDEVILEYIKDSKRIEEYLKIKEQLSELNSIEKLQHSNYLLLEETKIIRTLEKDISRIKKEVEVLCIQVETLQNKNNFKFLTWLRSFRHP